MSKKYRQWVSEQPCCISGYQGEGTQAHHIIGYSFVTGKGMAKKGADLTCIPLRHDLHKELHDQGYITFELKYNISQLEEMVKMILRAEKEGIL